MLQCPKCKKNFSEDYTFCEECGVKLIKADLHATKQQEYKVFDKVGQRFKIAKAK